VNEAPGPPVGLGPQLNEFVLGLVLRVAREVVGIAWVPERTWFAHPAPTSARAIASYFGGPVQHGASTSGIAIPEAIATRPFLSYDATLHERLGAHLEELLPLRGTSQALTARTRAEVAVRLGRAGVSVALIARTLGMSPRSLQRGLAAEGVTFADVVEGTRRSLAEILMSRAELSIEEIASLLGYAGLRPFARAFKRWTGRSPTRWRGGQE
jgi:AraC-like DNA-binding protein